MHLFKLITSLVVTNIKLLCVLGSRPGLETVQNEYPDLEIWAAGVDEQLTPDGLINPGLGDTVSTYVSPLII